MSQLFPMQIERVDRITPEAVVLSIEVPDKLKPLFVYKAGQYISLELSINNNNVRRSYSICSEPQLDLLQVGVKEVPNGIFSTYVNKRLKKGDDVKVGVPQGRFVLDPDEKQLPIMAIAAGSGITPIMSIVKTLLANSSKTPITLIYGNKSPEKTMFYEELCSLEKHHPEQLNIHWVFSETNAKEYKFGRIDSSFINTVFNNCSSRPLRFYLCGPEALIKLSKEHLIGLGINKQDILFELFSSSNYKSKVIGVADKGVLKITCDEMTHTLDLVPGKTLLEIALQAKLDVPYSCQGGVCSSCIGKITNGKASMEKNQILTDEEVNEGLVLSCQAIPQSNEVSLDFDEI